MWESKEDILTPGQFEVALHCFDQSAAGAPWTAVANAATVAKTGRTIDGIFNRELFQH